MPVRIIAWDDDRTKKELEKKFKNSSEDRRPLEDQWIRNEQALYSVRSLFNQIGNETSLDSPFGGDVDDVGGSVSDVNVAYTFKNFRYIHAQMSANPPSVAMRPQTSDQDDHRKADAADRISRWSLRHYKLQEKQDQQNLQALGYGTGVMKTVWDSTIGDIVDYDPEKDEIKLEGDIAITVPHIRNLRLDPDAKSIDEIKWLFEDIYMDYDEACARWPEKEDELKNARIERNNSKSRSQGNSVIEDKHYNCVHLLEYWETGLPTNGYLGRYAITTINFDVIEKCRPSPFRFKRAGAVSRIENDPNLTDEQKQFKISRLPEQATLPYHFLTDIDVPNKVWGKSSVEYAAPLQDNLSRLDSAKLDNIKIHGVIRMVLPEAADLAEDSLSDLPTDVVKITGNQPPYYMNPPALMPDMSTERQNYVTGINDVMGTNESMFGQQSREQSGASMQYATNQGNMVRRRLFNKYVLNVESVYRAILNLIRKHWTVERTIHVIGKEKALEAIDIKGADIDGGYDIVGEYGVTLSLDPITRREEILSLQPLFKEAGIPARTSMRMLKLNELESMFDELDLAENRQKEIFDVMIATGAYVPPKKYRDHENMIAWAMRYFMTQEFESLPEEVQQLCERHIEERAQLAAQEKSGATPQPQQSAQQVATSPGPLPQEAAGPVPPPAGPTPIPA